MNNKKVITFLNGEKPTVNFWRKNTDKIYHPSQKSINRLHKTVSKTVNNHQANITITTYSYELEF